VVVVVSGGTFTIGNGSGAGGRPGHATVNAGATLALAGGTLTLPRLAVAATGHVRGSGTIAGHQRRHKLREPGVQQCGAERRHVRTRGRRPW